jgi:hypothetical protein
MPSGAGISSPGEPVEGGKHAREDRGVETRVDPGGEAGGTVLPKRRAST